MRRLVIEYWTPLVLWLLLIFFFSTDAFASTETSRFIVPFLKFSFPSLSPEGLEIWHLVIRKLGHISEYFILASLTYRSLRLEEPDLSQAKLQTLLFVAIAAALDETHQRVTVFRTASVVDVGYDCFGAVWALWIFTAYEARRLRTHSVL